MNATATDESWFALFPEGCPTGNLAMRGVWVAKSLVGLFAHLHFEARNPYAKPECVRKLLTEFNHNMRAMRELASSGYDQTVRKLYPATGVRVGDRRGSCYADIADDVGLSIYLRMIEFTGCSSLADALGTRFMPVDPDAVAAAWDKVRKLFAELSPDEMEQLDIAIESEYLAVAESANADDNAGGGQAEAVGKQTKRKRGRRKGSVASNVESDRRLAEAWETGHYRTYADLDTAKGLDPGEAKAAVDRHRKRPPEPEIIGDGKRRQGQ